MNLPTPVSLDHLNAIQSGFFVVGCEPWHLTKLFECGPGLFARDEGGLDRGLELEGELEHRSDRMVGGAERGSKLVRGREFIRTQLTLRHRCVVFGRVESCRDRGELVLVIQSFASQVSQIESWKLSWSARPVRQTRG